MKTLSENKDAILDGRTSHIRVCCFLSTISVLEVIDRDKFYELTNSSYVFYMSPR